MVSQWLAHERYILESLNIPDEAKVLLNIYAMYEAMRMQEGKSYEQIKENTIGLYH